MIKTAIVVLKTIKYSGDPIGRDIRIEIETSNSFIAIDRKIEKGTTAEFNREIVQIAADRASVNLPVKIRVIEKDLLFNDVGSVSANIKINLSAQRSHAVTQEVLVRESRGFPTRKVAKFHVNFEVIVVPGTIRYVGEIIGGWLLGKKANNQKNVDLPSYLKVSFNHMQSKREYCTILEGVLQGVKLSVKLGENEESYLLQKNSQTDPVALTYSISRKILTLAEKKYTTVDHPRTRWKKGLYDVAIPDYSHTGGHNYPESKLATVWFRIGHSGDRYIHTGTVSLGCITLTEHKKWDALCKIMMKARKGDGRSVGTLEVID